MKPNKLQQKVIDECIAELGFWRNSNDIDSPTHFCEINDITSRLVIDDKITVYQQDKLEDSLYTLWATIRQLQ